MITRTQIFRDYELKVTHYPPKNDKEVYIIDLNGQVLVTEDELKRIMKIIRRNKKEV